MLRPDAPREGVTRNLVLVQMDGYQDRRDFEAIKAFVETEFPEIGVTIVDNTFPLPGIERVLARLPTLVFSPPPLARFRPLRGRVYCGQDLSKPEQYQLLRKAKLPVPPTTLLRPGVTLDPAIFGEFVVLKPAFGETSKGKGVELIRTARVRYIPPEDHPDDHPGRRFPMMAQRFIDTGRYPHHMRLLALFGEPIYCIDIALTDPRPDLDADDATLAASQIATNGGDRNFTLCGDPDVLDLAKPIYRAMPDIALQGIDVVRDPDGRLWILEVNPRGWTWHISSAHGLGFRTSIAKVAGLQSDFSEAGRDIMVRQFDAFRVAARALAAKTLREAV